MLSRLQRLISVLVVCGLLLGSSPIPTLVTIHASDWRHVQQSPNSDPPYPQPVQPPSTPSPTQTGSVSVSGPDHDARTEGDKHPSESGAASMGVLIGDGHGEHGTVTESQLAQYDNNANTIAFVHGGADVVKDDLDELAVQGRIDGYDLYDESNISSLWRNLDQYATLLLDEDVIYEWEHPEPGNPAPIPITTIGRSLYDHRDQLGQWVYNGGGLFVTDQNDISGTDEMVWAWLPTALQVRSVDCSNCGRHNPANFEVVSDPGIFSRPNPVDVTRVSAGEAHGYFSDYPGYIPVVRDQGLGDVLEIYRTYGSGIVVLSHLEYETAPDPWDTYYVENETRLLGQQLQVEILEPVGGQYRSGGTMLVRARVSEDGAPVLRGEATGAISLGGDVYLSFDLADDSRNGDAVADDGVYSALIVLDRTMSVGNHTLQVAAQKIHDDGTISTGSQSTLFTVIGPVEGGPMVDLSFQGPSDPEAYAGETITLRLTGTYPDGVSRPGSVAEVIVTKPDESQETASLTNVGGGTWQGTYTLGTGGRYFLDGRLTPPSDTPYAPGYAGLVLDAFMGYTALMITPVGLPETFARNSAIPLHARVTTPEGMELSNATVVAWVGDDEEFVSLAPHGEGEYLGYFTTPNSGDYTVRINASAPFWVPGTVTTSFRVSNVSIALLDKVDKFATSVQTTLDDLESTSAEVARDGDWFWNQAPADKLERTADAIIDLTFLGVDFKGFFQSFPKSTRFIKGKWSSAFLFKRLNNQIQDEWLDGRMFRSWATRFGSAVRDSLLHGPSQWSDWHVGRRVMERAAVYMGTRALTTAADKLTIQIIGETLASKRKGDSSFLQNQVQGWLGDAVLDAKYSVSQGASDVRSHPPVGLPAPEGDYIRDLNLRQEAHVYIAQDTRQRSSILFSAYDARNEPWWKRWFKPFVEFFLSQSGRPP